MSVSAKGTVDNIGGGKRLDYRLSAWGHLAQILYHESIPKLVWEGGSTA